MSRLNLQLELILIAGLAASLPGCSNTPGRVSATGGASAAGGVATSGGASATGGMATSGGASATGGMATTGGETGTPTSGAGTGGSTALTLAQSCSKICSVVSGTNGLQCPSTANPTTNLPLDSAECNSSCVSYSADSTNTAMVPLYEAMMVCTATNLTALAEYECATIGPLGGALNGWFPAAATICEDAICTWTCSDAVNGYSADLAVFTRCTAPANPYPVTDCKGL